MATGTARYASSGIAKNAAYARRTEPAVPIRPTSCSRRPGDLLGERGGERALERLREREAVRRALRC
eukprot:7229305-Alexandrium_andersonii.AAC.1